MRNLLVASALGLTIASGSAFAADMRMPVKAPAPPPPVVTSTWTGCYLDAGGGYGMWNQDEYVETAGFAPLTSSYTNGGRGWLGRFGGGCDYQLSGMGLSNWIIGAFADYDAMSLKGTPSLANVGVGPFSGPPVSSTEKESDAWAVGGRIGYLVTPALLTYFDGGYTETRFGSRTLSFTQPSVGGLTGVVYPSHTYHGWFVGGGTEYALNFAWLPIKGLYWRNEYRYGQYRAADIPGIISATGAPNGFAVNDKKEVQTITTSLVWRFNWGGPIATRY